MAALEACGGAHHWACQLIHLDHQVRLIPPAYVKPFVKRHKNDAVVPDAGMPADGEYVTWGDAPP